MFTLLDLFRWQHAEWSSWRVFQAWYRDVAGKLLELAQEPPTPKAQIQQLGTCVLPQDRS